MTSTFTPTIGLSEILAHVSSVKSVFASAKGPRVAELLAQVNQIEDYLQNYSPTIAPAAKEIPVTVSNDNDFQSENFFKIAQKIQAVSNPETVLQVSIEELQSVLSVARILIYRLEANKHTQAIAEVHQEDYQSLLHRSFPTMLFDTFNEEHLPSPKLVQLTSAQQPFWQLFQVENLFYFPLFSLQQHWGLLVIHQGNNEKALSEKQRFLCEQIGTLLNLVLSYLPLNTVASEQPLIQVISSIETEQEKQELIEAPPISSLSQTEQEKQELIEAPPISSLSQTEQEKQELIEDPPIPSLFQTEQEKQKLIEAPPISSTIATDSFQLSLVQDSLTIAQKKLQYFQTIHQQATTIATNIESLNEQIEIVSLNTAMEATKSDGQIDLITIAEQLEALADNSRQATMDMARLLANLEDTSHAVKLSLESVMEKLV